MFLCFINIYDSSSHFSYIFTLLNDDDDAGRVATERVKLGREICDVLAVWGEARGCLSNENEIISI